MTSPVTWTGWNRQRYTPLDFVLWFGGFMAWDTFSHYWWWLQFPVGIGLALVVALAREALRKRRLRQFTLYSPPVLDPAYRCPDPCPEDCGMTCWSGVRRIIDGEKGIQPSDDRQEAPHA